MKIARIKEKIATLAFMLAMFPQTAFARDYNNNSDSTASSIQDAIDGASSANFDSVDDLFSTVSGHLSDWIPQAATVSLLIGVFIAFLCAPLRKYRGAGVAIIVVSLGVLLGYMMLPTIITMLTNG